MYVSKCSWLPGGRCRCLRMCPDPVLSARVTCPVASPHAKVSLPLPTSDWREPLSPSWLQTQAGPTCYCSLASQEAASWLSLHWKWKSHSLCFVGYQPVLPCVWGTPHRESWQEALSCIWFHLSSLGLWHNYLEPGAWDSRAAHPAAFGVLLSRHSDPLSLDQACAQCPFPRISIFPAPSLDPGANKLLEGPGGGG